MKTGKNNYLHWVFLDSGGDENYSNNESHVLTIAPDTPGAKVVLSFNSFLTEGGFDYLKIYNGINKLAPLVSYSSGTFPPGKIEADSLQF